MGNTYCPDYVCFPTGPQGRAYFDVTHFYRAMPWLVCRGYGFCSYPTMRFFDRSHARYLSECNPDQRIDHDILVKQKSCRS